MTIIYEHNRQLPAPGYAGVFNWSVQQPIFRPNVANYVADARQLTPRFEDMVFAFSQELNFPLNIRIAEPKTEESAERKLWDRKATHLGRPEMLKDYGRGSISVGKTLDGIDNLDELIVKLIHSQNTVAYKDQFYHPNSETGYRSFKAIWEVSGHNFELLVEYDGMNEANKMTKHLRNIERNLKDFENDIPRRCISKMDVEKDRKAAKMTVGVEEAIQAMRDARRGISEMFATECGLNRLLDPALMTDHGQMVADSFLTAAKTSKSIYSKPAHAIIERAQQYLLNPDQFAYN